MIKTGDHPRKKLCRHVTVLAASIIILLVVVIAVVGVYLIVNKFASTVRKEEAGVKAAIIEEAVYREEKGQPILSLYIRNVGKSPLTPDRVYLWGSPQISGKPRIYNVSTKVITVVKQGWFVASNSSFGGETITLNRWFKVCDNLHIKNVWGGDEWRVNIDSKTATRTRRGLIALGTDLTGWTIVKTSNARGSCNPSGSRVVINVRSTNGRWAAISYRTSLPSSLYPPFVIECRINKKYYSNAWQTNVAVYLTRSKSSSNPYNDNPFYEAGVFYYSGKDYLEGRVRDSAGKVTWVNPSVQGSRGRIILVVESLNEGSLHSYYTSSMYGGEEYTVSNMRSPRYIWLTVETKSRSSYGRTGEFYLNELKIYRSPSFKLYLETSIPDIIAYNLTFKTGSSSTSIISSSQAITISPMDSSSLYEKWLSSGYPWDAIVDVSVLRRLHVMVSPSIKLNITLSSIEVKVLNPPPDFNKTLLSIVLEKPQLQVLEWSLTGISIEDYTLKANATMLIGKALVTVKVVYNNTLIGQRIIEVPIYKEYQGSGEASVSNTTSNVNVAISVSGELVYNKPVLIEARMQEGRTVGIGEDSVEKELQPYTGTQDVWLDYTSDIILNEVYGGDEYRIEWNDTSGGWCARKIVNGLVWFEGFNSSDSMRRWTLKTTSGVTASKGVENGWGFIKAKRTSWSQNYPVACLVRRIGRLSSIVVEAKLWRNGNYGNKYMTSIYLTTRNNTADPWYARDWVMMRIRWDKNVQAGVSRSWSKRWSTVWSGAGWKASLVLSLSNGRAEYWLWNNHDRTGDPRHTVFTGAPSTGDWYVYLVHKYYRTYGSSSYAFSKFDDIIVYRGTSLRIIIPQDSSLRINRVAVYLPNGTLVADQVNPSSTLTLDLANSVMRSYWLSHGCPLKLKLRVTGEKKDSVSVTVNSKLQVRVRVFANFTLMGYSIEDLQNKLELKAKILNVTVNSNRVLLKSTKDYVKAEETVSVTVRVRITARVGNHTIYEKTLLVTGQGTGTGAGKAHSPVSINVLVPVYIEKDITHDLSGGGGSVKLLLDDPRRALQILPGESRKVDFVLEDKLERGHWYKVKLVFKEGFSVQDKLFVP